MMLSRRDLLKRLSVAGLVLAAPEPLRRYWQLDQTMVSIQFERSPAGWSVSIDRSALLLPANTLFTLSLVSDSQEPTWARFAIHDEHGRLWR